MSALDELLKKHRKKIIDREKKTFRELLKAYQEIEKDLSKSFKKLENEMKAALESGEEIDPSWLYKEQRLKKLLEQTNEQIIRFGGKAAKIIESEQQKAIEIAAEQSKEVYKFLLNQTPDASAFIPSLNTRNLETAVGLMGDKSPLISYFAETLAPDVAEKIRSEVIKATALGTNFQTVAKNLRAAGDISKSRAFSLARTEINRVRRETTREIFQENNDLITGWEWCAAKSSRTCALCLAMDGKQFPLSEPFPQHVNCRCSMLSVLIGLPSPKRTLGKDWFEAQSDDVKKQILGKEAFEQYQEGNVGLGDFVAFRTDKRFGKSVTRRPLAQILSEKGIVRESENMKILRFKSQANKTAQKLLAEARKHEPQITKDVERIANLKGGQIAGLEDRLKSEESLERKLQDNALRWNSSISREGKRNNDTLRYTMIFPIDDYRKGYSSVLTMMEAEGYDVRKIFNAWKTEGEVTDTGYRGLNITLISSQNQRFELQFHTKESFQMKTKTHSLYEEFRSAETSDKRKTEIQRIMLKKAAKIKRPEGI